MEPTAPVPPRTIQTPTQTALEHRIPRRRFSFFGYPSESESEHESIEQRGEEIQQPVVFPEQDDSEPLFSDREEILSEPASSLLPPLTVSSAPLLSSPALTDTLSNFPLFSSRASSSREPEPAEEDKPQEGIDVEDQPPGRSQETSLTSDGTVRGRGRPRCRPPGCRRVSATSSSRTNSRANRPHTRSKGRMRIRAQSRTLKL